MFDLLLKTSIPCQGCDNDADWHCGTKGHNYNTHYQCTNFTT